MIKNNAANNRFIINQGGIIGPTAGREISVVYKTAADFPGIRQSYLDMAIKYANMQKEGTPICEALLELVQHMFTEEEADICKHVRPNAWDNTAESIAIAAGRPIDEVQKVLDTLTDIKRILASLSVDKTGKKIYLIIPILPGTFERVLITTSMDSLNEWQKKFAVLFEKLFESGYTAANRKPKDIPLVRYLPIGQSIKTNPIALPAEKLEEVFSPYKVFGVGLCQCRMTEKIVGRGCGKPLEVCTVMGNMAEPSIKAGRLRSVELKELLEIKARAEQEGLISWMMNVNPALGSNISCSCCGCCCHFMRALTEFSLPTYVAPPHFIPKRIPENCNNCGKCALACPMGALTVNKKAQTYQYKYERCIGCGQCSINCARNAINMEAVPEYQFPAQTVMGFI
jgi:Pyruvate/2-oxoacid:ferredoxin oxidoreductase delta subunit